MVSELVAVESTVEGERGRAESRRVVHSVSVLRRRWIAVSMALVLLLGAVGYFTANEVQANTQFDQAHRSLDVTQHNLDSVLAELAAARRNLAVEKSGVVADSAALAKDTSELHGVQKALLNAQANVTHQGSTIGELSACLGGVEQALNALAVADQSGAIAALNSVSTSCSQAVASDA
jgi:hypothetical protein